MKPRHVQRRRRIQWEWVGGDVCIVLWGGCEMGVGCEFVGGRRFVRGGWLCR